MIDKPTGMKIDPCPFCGKDVAEVTNAMELEMCDNFEDEDVCPALQLGYECSCMKVVCNFNAGGCGSTGAIAWKREKAIEKWNRRAG